MHRSPSSIMPFVEHADRGGVLEAGHHLVEVREGVGGRPMRVARHQQRGFVAEGKGPQA